MTIKEFAGFVGLSVSTLRYYDRIGIFSPAKRGVDLENKYRYYSPAQITTVKMIRVLTEIGVPLKVIKELAKGRTPEKLIKLLGKNMDKIADEISFLQEVFSVINAYLCLLNEGMGAIETEMSVSEMPERRLVLGNVNDYGGASSFYGEFIRFCNAPYNPILNMSYPIGGYWASMEDFSEEPSLPMRFFSLDPKGDETKPAGLYLNGYTRGYYGHTNDLAERMMAYAEKHNLVFIGPVFNTYLFDEISMTNPEQYLLQVSASVKETQRAQSRRTRRRL